MFKQAQKCNTILVFATFIVWCSTLNAQDHLFTITSNPFDTKVLIAEKENDDWVLVEEPQILQKAIEEEYYDGTQLQTVQLMEKEGNFYLFSEGTVSNGSPKIVRLSLEIDAKTQMKLYLTTKSKLESCYAVRCREQDFAEKTCICNEPTEFGISSYQAQEGFFLTKKGVGGLITAKRLSQSTQKTADSKRLIPIQTILGTVDGPTLTYNQGRLHQAIEEEMVTTAQIDASFISVGNGGKYYLLARGEDGSYIDYVRIALNMSSNGELFITPSSTMEICRTNCHDVGSFTMGGECECLTTDTTQKDFRFTSKSNFLNTSAGIGSLFAEQQTNLQER